MKLRRFAFVIMIIKDGNEAPMDTDNKRVAEAEKQETNCVLVPRQPCNSCTSPVETSVIRSFAGNDALDARDTLDTLVEMRGKLSEGSVLDPVFIKLTGG